MNILHLVDEPYDSGIVHYALTAARGLRDRGHAVAVGGLPGHFPLDRAAHLGLETFAVRRLAAGVLDLRRRLSARPVQLIDAHTGSSHALAVAATRALRGAPAVVRTRGDGRALRRRPAAALLWRRTAGFIAATDAILGEYRAAWPRAAVPARAILPGLPDPDAGAPASESPPRPLRVGIVARLDPVKGHAYFLRAAARVARAVPDSVFVVAGREENVSLAALRRLASGLGLARSVEFLGHAPDALEIMRRCHAGVVASVGSEAVSRVAIEWMSVGRPLVATAVGSLPEIVAGGETGILVPPSDHGAMAAALLDILGDRDLRQEMGRRARLRFTARFGLGRFIDETEAFYHEIIPSR